MAVTVLTVLLLLGTLCVAHPCPQRCLCYRTTVRCMFLQLDRVPKVPLETTILDLRFNRIHDIPPGSFKGLKHLNTLLINNNRITKIENGTFEGLSELQYLYLYKNQIKSIGSRAFQGLQKLEQLYIHFNEVTDLEPDTFSKLPALERLFLHNNKLKRLPSKIFSGLGNLKRLRLDSNALVCDCGMIWLSEMLRKKQGDTEAAVTCDYPSKVHGKSLLSVSSEDLKCKKPEITVAPHDVDLSFGNTAYFTCRAEGDPQPEIIWLHNRQQVVPNSVDQHSRYSVLADGTLMIEDTKDTDQGVYECVARNAAGATKTNAVELRHHGNPVRPLIVKGPKDIRAIAGETVVLECRVTGYPKPEVKWYRNDLPVRASQSFNILRTGSLVINNVQHEDRGIYRCTATNRLGAVQAAGRILVQVQPNFTERPRNQTVTAGHPVVLTCQVDGYPIPTISWTKDGRPLTASSHVSFNARKTALRISDVEFGDAGKYSCNAESSAGKVGAIATLTVRSSVPLQFSHVPTNTQVPIHTSVQVQCQAVGNPRPRITWRKGNLVLRSSPHFVVRDDGYLTIHNVTRDDEGDYVCVADNGLSYARTTFKLSVIGNAQPPRVHRVYPGDPFVNASIREAINRVGTAINKTLKDIKERGHPKTPSDLLNLFRRPTPGAIQITRASEIFEQTLELIHRQVVAGAKYNISYNDIPYSELVSPHYLTVIANLSGCLEHRRIPDCDDMCFHNRYRTFDGTCNNLKHPMWGASQTPLKRLIHPSYENGFNTPVGWNRSRLYFGFHKPSARAVSLKVLSAKKITEDESYTHLLMQWGQFLDHDLDFSSTQESNARFSDGRFCNETCESQSPCFPIPVPTDDPRIRRHRCLGFTRSSSICGSGSTSIFFETVTHREQMNHLTAYIDASNVYGNADREAWDLRDFSTERGLLRTGRLSPSGKPLLPSNDVGRVLDCQMDPNKAHVGCFLAGDHRANEQLGLLSMHTVWMREHNRIATELRGFNPHWDGNLLFHESRKIVGAMMQHITYTHWLPKILGSRGMDLMGKYEGYNSSVESSIANSFSTAAFRFGHSLVNPVLYRFNSTFQPIPQGHLPLHKAFFAPFRLVEEGGVDPILRGLIGVAAKKSKAFEFMNTELTEKLFKLAHAVALDLGALNTQRGRDHGLPSYNDFRKFCKLPVAQTFEDLKKEITDAGVRKKLKELYGHPGNIDLFVGGLSETSIQGARVGPTFMCIMADQFRRLRSGDRFWYENPGLFSSAQLQELRHASMGRVLCDNGDDIKEVQPDVFHTAKYPRDFVKCDIIPYMNLKVWTACCQDCANAGKFNSITSHFRRRRSVDYSFPQDKPYEEHDRKLNSIPQDDKTKSNSVVQHDDKDLNKITPKLHAGNHTIDSKIKNKMMDLIDVRIEGVEDVMVDLKKTVVRLSRKLRRLERRMNTKEGGGDICTDHLGKPRKPREKWKEHDCKKCHCKLGQVECVTEMCPVPSCQFPKKVKDECCPVC